MMDAAHVRTTFIRLKPKCDAFLNDPSKATLAPLVSEYRGLEPRMLQDIHPYLLFPYTVHLRNPQVKSIELKMAMVDAMYEVFSKTTIDNVDTYLKYFTLMITQKFDKSISDSVDEDFALSVIKVITVITLRIPNDQRIKIYTRSNATKLGQGIFICVQLAKKERYKALRLAAINCILAICSIHDDLMKDLHNPKFNLEYANHVGDVLMFFLPGLLGAMQDISEGEQKQGHAVTCLAIRTINRVLCLTLMDKAETEVKNNLTDEDFIKLIKTTGNSKENQNESEPDPFGMKLRAKGIEGMKEHLENAKRNKDWYHAAGQKLIILMKSIVSVQYHPHEKVRLEISFMCANILMYCPRNMSPSLKYILEMLIVLSEDDVKEITENSKDVLERFTNNNPTFNQRQLLDILEENFNNVFTRLPRYLNKLELNFQVRGMRLLKGYLRLLSNGESNSPQRLTKILSCSHILNRFAIILVEMFKLESSGMKLLEECSLRDVETPVQESEPWKVYTYLQNDLSVKTALEICKVLGRSEAIEIIVDYLLEQYRLDNEYKKEIIFLLNETLSASCDDEEKNHHLIRNVILTYIDYENWYLPTTVEKSEKPLSKNETLDPTIYNPREWVKERTFDLYEGAVETRYTDISYRHEDESYYACAVDNKDSCRTLVEAQDNVVKISLMTEGIGKLARRLKKDFQPYLLKTLYLILERAGSGIEAIHLSGMRALTDIAKAFDLKDITELIKINADYFTHHVNIKLRKITDNADVLDVLLVVIRFSESEVLPCLYEIVSNVLEQYSGLYPQQYTKLFLKLFFTFIKYIETEFFKKQNGIDTSEGKDVKIKSILYEMREFQNNLNIVKDFENSVDRVENNYVNGENLTDDENEELKDNADEKKEVPIHVKMVISVLKRTINFLPSNNLDEKLLALDILKDGIVLVKDYEDELLPLVHQIWSPLVPRFKETTQPIVINRSFKLLTTLALLSKDFIRRRTMKEVLPLLCDYLMRRSKNSLLKDVGSSYRFTQAYKLQLLLVENLADLCICLNLQEKSINDVICVVQKYLSRKQPKPLQKACVNFFKKLSTYDIGACCLHLYGIWNDGLMNVRLDDLNLTSLNKCKFPIIDPSESKDCKINVCTILEILNVKI